MSELVFKKLWAELFDYAGADVIPGDWQAAYERTIAPYNDLSRSYHNLDHVEEMVLYLYDYPGWPLTAIGQREKFTAIAAAFFHDYVDPRSPEAELLSAEACLREMMSWGIVKPTTHLMVIATNASKAILTTKDHVGYSVVEQMLIDADLQRFVTGDWRVWANQIRLEYADVPEALFNEGRLAVLERFRSRSPFFYLAQHQDCEAYRRLDEQIAECKRLIAEAG